MVFEDNKLRWTHLLLIKCEISREYLGHIVKKVVFHVFQVYVNIM